MNGSGEAEMIIRMALQGAMYFIRLTGDGATHMVAMLKALKDKPNNSPGVIKLKEMLKSGKPTVVFSIPEDKLGEFASETKLYGIQYVMAERHEGGRAIWDLLVYAEDASKIQRVAENIGITNLKQLDGKLETNVTEEEKQRAVEITIEQKKLKDMMSPNKREREAGPERSGLTEERPSGSSSSGINSVNGRISIMEELGSKKAEIESAMDIFAMARDLRQNMMQDAPQAVKDMHGGWEAPAEEYDTETGERLYRGKRAADMTELDKLQYMVDSEMASNGILRENTIKSLYEAGYRVDKKGIVSANETTLTSRERKLVADMMSEPVRDKTKDVVKDMVNKGKEAFINE